MLGSLRPGKEAPTEFVASRLSLPKISAVDVFRVNVNGDTELGRQAKAHMDLGDLVPDELVTAMVHARLTQNDARDGFVLEGFPRTVPQAQALKKILATEFDAGLDLVLQPLVDEEKVVRWLSGRYTCAQCWRIWHVDFDDIQDGLCGNCGGDLIQRDDDKEEVVRHHLQAYQEQSAILGRFYADEGILVGFDATGSVEEVTNRALHLIRRSTGVV
ncbi:nucleoside monophosphate kinase [Actinomadura kijaniata]|uniref:nucleoside monophosphate kinase n=1 Tax=Actinomadura kijaniata TaxID=46161 RepID=UPI003F1DE5D6